MAGSYPANLMQFVHRLPLAYASHGVGLSLTGYTKLYFFGISEKKDLLFLGEKEELLTFFKLKRSICAFRNEQTS